jgi:putative membrane protein
MLYRTTTCLALSFAVALTFGPAAAQEKEVQKAGPEDQFLIKAAMANNAVVRMAELVETRSENPKVEEFARLVLADHKRAGDKLGEIAKKRNVGVAAGLEQPTRDEIDRLSKLKGADFDKAFLDSFIKGHEACLKHCDEVATTGKEETTVGFGKECKTMIEKHLKQAKELRQGLGN